MSDKVNDANNADTVQFNVGGKVYEVSRSLLSQYPDSMLIRMVSKPWLKSDQKEPLFIDRNGERFQYCLDYMRDGRVALPITVSKKSLLNDMTFYGFKNVDPDVFSVDMSPAACVVSTKFIKTLIIEKEMDIEFRTLALYCFKRFQNSGTTAISFYSADKDYEDFHDQPENLKFCGGKIKELCTIVRSLQGNDVEKKTAYFGMYLDEYGFKLESIDYTSYPIAPCIHLSFIQETDASQDEHEITA